MVSQQQAYSWGVKAGREAIKPPNPFSNSAARAAWEAGFASAVADLKEFNDSLLVG